MAKRRSHRPLVVDTFIPVYIPTEGGVGDLELGKASIKSGTLVVEFNNKLPSVAIQRRIERGELVGITFVIPEDEAEAARKSEAQREKELAEQEAEEVPAELTDRDKRDLELLDTIEPEQE